METERVRTARMTGLLYLGVAIAGFGFYFALLPRLFAPGDPQATLANLVAHESQARAIVAVELMLVVTQALTALWFQRLFHAAQPLAAAGIAAFGMVNAVAGLVSAALLATAAGVAAEPFGDAAAMVQLLYQISDDVWGVAALFFGLWLIPMGWCVLRTGWMPKVLGWILVGGGVGYVLSAFVRYLVPDLGVVAEALAYPASVGEFWMVGYLLIFGVRRPRTADAAAGSASSAAAVSAPS
ncbi:DUF4386 domain-containing protein [Dactylosporangium sp. CS-033363]|uniref:DUF4386 domain-containing protein n=1 Tax=Dactylosporangium sp. CS-033363 TaxID=3239935 RepID=UPI003D8BBCA5